MTLTRLFWIVFTVAMAVYLAMAFWTVPHLAALTDGQMILDMRPTGYSHAEVVDYLVALGDDGRVFYLTVQHRLDLAYPALLAASFGIGFAILYRGWLRWGLIGAAVLGMVADYTENAHVAAILHAGAGAVSVEMVQSASFWTLVKSAADSLCYMALLIGGGLALIARWKRRG
ncbi:hypothetical protein [Thalassovita sp.]|uniref:hypothetical protein n=1 Tax=Thalassovita sp. TaxID=1979401 RepID=UPI002B26CE1C|nr:hypothetical protein [Thalassovita sp.]